MVLSDRKKVKNVGLQDKVDDREKYDENRELGRTPGNTTLSIGIKRWIYIFGLVETCFIGVRFHLS